MEKKTVETPRPSLWCIPADHKPRMARYTKLLETIRENNYKSIMEIGVLNGVHARQMILAALETLGKVYYYGFDLFEDATPEILEKEISPYPPTEAIVREYLRGIGVHVELFRGFSADTVPLFMATNIKPDLIFIDGSHRTKNTQIDWDNCKKLMHENSVVFFDDYMSNYEEVGWGCNEVVDAIEGYDIEFCEPHDTYMARKQYTEERFLTEARLVKVWNAH